MLLVSVLSTLFVSMGVSAASNKTGHCAYVPSKDLSLSVGRYTTSVNGTNAYNVARLEVPPASSCLQKGKHASSVNAGTIPGTGDDDDDHERFTLETLACVRRNIDAIDLQMSYLIAHRADQALLAAHLKHDAGQALDAPARDVAVKEKFGTMVQAFGGTAELGREVATKLVGATLALEEESIRRTCHQE